MSAETPTPRTDAVADYGWSGDAVCVSADFARQLERELFAANQVIATRILEVNYLERELQKKKDDVAGLQDKLTVREVEVEDLVALVREMLDLRRFGYGPAGWDTRAKSFLKRIQKFD